MLAWRRGLGATSPYASQVQALAPSYGIPPSLALAVMQAESSGIPTAVSPKGAQGLFQIMPANDASLGITDPFDPTQNIQGGLSLLQQYYQQFGDWNSALEAYNQGPNSLQKQLAAGQTPVAAGYASGILAAAGPLDGFTSSDLSMAGDSTPSSDGSVPLDLSSMTGLSWGTAAAVLVGLIVLGMAFRR
jgi:soluble lytic murein transglycosylase-like protein